ncbi:MAG: DHA2 family efflux MFS transporter permease subunit, partial [Acidimicrobiales bacterium]
TFLLALVFFTGASVLCGVATSLGQLVFFRVLQGVGGGMLAPVGTAMLFRAFPPERRARASSVLLIPTVMAPALGPLIGGLLVDQLSWRWVFYVNLPIGIAAFIFGLIFLVEHREPDTGRFDLPGFILAGAGLALVLYAVSQGPPLGWGSPAVLVTGTMGVAALVALVHIELRKRQPMLDLRLLSDRLFRSTNAVSIFGYAGFIGFLFAIPLFLQEVRGISALNSGLTTFPEALGVLVSSRLVVRLYPKIGPRRLMAGGLASVGVVMALLTQVGLGTNLWLVRLAMFVMGAGMAYLFLPLQAACFARITPAATGRASAIFNTQRQMAAAVGVAALATVLAATLPAHRSVASLVASPAGVRSFRLAFLAAAVISFLGAAAALRIHDVDAAGTMRLGVKGPG